MLDSRPIRKLTTRQRQVLYLRVAGFSYERIGGVLGIAPSTVKDHITKLNRCFLPGVTDQPHTEPTLRLAYALGVLDGGGEAAEVHSHIESLISRAVLLPSGRSGGGQTRPDP